MAFNSTQNKFDLDFDLGLSTVDPAYNNNMTLTSPSTFMAVKDISQNYPYLDYSTSDPLVNVTLTLLSQGHGRSVSSADKAHTVMVSCFMFAGGVMGNLLALFVLARSGPEQRKTLFYKVS